MNVPSSEMSSSLVILSEASSVKRQIIITKVSKINHTSRYLLIQSTIDTTDAENRSVNIFYIFYDIIQSYSSITSTCVANRCNAARNSLYSVLLPFLLKYVIGSTDMLFIRSGLRSGRL